MNQKAGQPNTHAAHRQTGTRFGELLRLWRNRRGRTQFDLADHAGFSQRHLSFLESGRAKPSRSAVVILAEALEVPVVERNVLLQSAGFAPLYSAEPLDSNRLRYALSALESVVQSHRPFPALIVDRAWNMRSANANAMALFVRFMPSLMTMQPDKPLNVMRLCVEPGELRSAIRNWLPFTAWLLGQLKIEHGRLANQDLGALIDLIENDPEFRSRGREAAELVGSPVPTLQLEASGLKVELFTLLSTFTATSDANLAEMRVETFFPADDASRAVLLALDDELRNS